MNTVSYLLPVLFSTLVCGIIGLIVLISRKKDDARYEKIAAIATFMASISTIVVGIITVKVMMRQEESERLRNQPLYAVHIGQNYSSEKGLYDNEEYVVSNEGNKTRSKTTVSCESILEINYDDNNTNKHITKYLHLNDYFGASVPTGNLEGTVQYSVYSGNNNELFVKFYKECLAYEGTHPMVYVEVQLKHYFIMEYVDIYGEKHTVVSTKDSEIDEESFSTILEQADKESIGKHLSIKSLDLDEIIETYFKEELKDAKD